MDLDQLESDFTPYIDPRLYVKKIETLGLGVFTKKEINPGETIEIAPVVICSFELKDENLLKYVVAWENQLAVGLGWTMIYNHSDKNSCEFSVNLQDKLIAIMTNRKIKENEQLTVNYGPMWFSSRSLEKINI